MLRCFREEEEKTRGACKNLFIYESRFCLLTILMDSQSSKSCFKAVVLNPITSVTLLCTPGTGNFSPGGPTTTKKNIPLLDLIVK